MAGSGGDDASGRPGADAPVGVRPDALTDARTGARSNALTDALTDALADALTGGETIAAVATAAGRGALAIVRLTGPDAPAIAARLGATLARPRVARRVRLVHPRTGAPLDDALAIRFEAPHSATGEHVVEFTTHGGRVVPQLVLGACLAAGAREAAPGEFTRRAVLAGKLDLLQAEAIADLTDARGSAQQRAALAQLDGGLSRRLETLREACVTLEALLAYDIDFPEEDDGPVPPARITRELDALVRQLEALLATAPAVPLLRDGAIAVLAGAPNSGKSSLFNALLGEARAIVTDVPGTTRDALEGWLDTAGVPLRLVDTAGLRESDDPLERLGIEVGTRWLQRAHVVLVCGDTPEALARAIDAVRAHAPDEVPLVPVRTMADRKAPMASNGSGAAREAAATGATAAIATSAVTGDGLPALLGRVAEVVAACYGVPPDEAPRLTRERHRIAVARARDELRAFAEAWRAGAGMPAMVAAVHLRAATEALGELVGRVDVEDVLDRLFADFCVGK